MEDFGFIEKILGWTWKTVKLLIKIMTIGFRQGWGYLVVGIYLFYYTSNITPVNDIDYLLSIILLLTFIIGGIVLMIKKIRKNKREKLGIETKRTKKGKNKKLSTGKIILKTIIGVVVLGIISMIIMFTNRMTEVIYTTIGYAQIFWVIYNISTLMESKKIKRTEYLNPSPPSELISNTAHGITFGKKDGATITKPENMDGHVLVVGGVGSGKSSCIAIPSLRGWSESVFAIDIKGELYEKTKNHRSKIMVFNPLDENSYGYDPFFCLHTSRNPAQDARAIAHAIVPLPPDTKDPFWIESAQNIFTAAILHYSAQNLSFLETIEQIQSTTPKALIKELCSSSEREARFCVNSLADMEDRTLSSIMSELSKNIVPFVTDKNLKSALSRKNNIMPEDLEFGYDVYINIPEHLLHNGKTS